MLVEAIHSPHIFPASNQDVEPPVDISLISFIIDGFEATSMRKSSITDPTVLPKEWTTEVYRAFEHLKPEHKWRAIPFMAGLLRAIYFQEETFRGNSSNNGTGLGSRSNGMLSLSDKYLTERLQRGFVDMINDTMMFYGNREQLPSPGAPLNSKASIAIFSLATVLPFLEPSATSHLYANSLVINTAYFIYLSPQCLDGGKYLRGDKISSLSAVLTTSPTFTKLNLLSNILQTCIQVSNELSIENLMEALNIIYRFSESIAFETNNATPPNLEFPPEAWQYLKLSLFSISAALQGYISLILLSPERHIFTKYAIPVSANIIQILSNLFFIVAQISLSGFPTFDTVYYTSMDILLNPQFNRIKISEIIKEMCVPILAMGEMQRNVAISKSLVLRGKIIFLLNITEMVVPFLTAGSPSINSQTHNLPLSLVDDVLPLANAFLLPLKSTPDTPNLTLTYIQPILESAHSVMLAIISTPGEVAERSNGTENPFVLPSFMRLTNFTGAGASNKTSRALETAKLSELSREIVLSYFDKVNSLFPSILSYKQFLFAITTLVRSLSPPSPLFSMVPEGAQYILDALLEHSDNIEPGTPLSSISGTQRLTNYDATTAAGASVGADSKSFDGSSDMQTPPTVRSVVLAAVIHSLPYLELDAFQKYLSVVWQKVGQTRKMRIAGSNLLVNQKMYEEQQFLEVQVFDMISQELEQQKATVGIRWYYERPSL